MDVSDPLDDTLVFNQTGLVRIHVARRVHGLTLTVCAGGDDGLEGGRNLGRLPHALGKVGIRARGWPGALLTFTEANRY